MFQSSHEKGHHGFGGIWGSRYGSYHHNLLAHHASRNPHWASGVGYNDYRNNVIYNWAYNSCYGGEKVEDSYPETFNFFTVDMVSKYYKSGPATQPGKVSWRIANPAFDPETDMHGKWYIADNEMEGNAKVSTNNWNGGVQTKNDSLAKQRLKLENPWPSMPIKQQTAHGAYKIVLENAGAVLPKRDAVDMRIIKETRNGTATYEGKGYKLKKQVAHTSKICGIIDSQNDVGGWPVLKSTQAPKDSDQDGMPDKWEKENKLDPNNSEDRSLVGSDGYTMLEKYINSIQ